ncbi:hypothetical protein [Pseudomonas sp. URMO17WK12:I11]|uniref:hypothetical protein n=1 Tax=Pseudomonas sp. URMO17WK12:I11 TaxID=1283291 RepID=UPI0007219B36|nr:hypothetical protein [Pseudomonas sp. URMO17WK12:I11]CRL47615.1 hypothetical protein PSHI_06420 [Pseudomonas sp. URMO17WK12:I11]
MKRQAKAEEQQEPTAEAIKQCRKREKEAAKNAALGIGKFQIEVAGVFKPDLQRVMKAHGINIQQDIHQRLLRNLISADFEAQEWMLRNVTTPYEPNEKVSRAFHDQSMLMIQQDPGDEIISPG